MKAFLKPKIMYLHRKRPVFNMALYPTGEGGQIYLNLVVLTVDKQYSKLCFDIAISNNKNDIPEQLTLPSDKDIQSS